MNKRQWFASTDPQAMLRFLKDRASDRKLRLFAVACCRRHWPAFADDETSRHTVEVAERLADGTATVRECRIARAVVEVPWGPGGDSRLCYLRELARAAAKADAGAAALDASGAADSFARHAVSEAAEATWAQSSAAGRHASELESGRQVTSVRCIFGNPFRSIAVEPSWLTSDVFALAQGMYESRDFSAMPILADALQDAGCTNDDALKHLRNEREHARGCWVLDLVLGKG